MTIRKLAIADVTFECDPGHGGDVFTGNLVDERHGRLVTVQNVIEHGGRHAAIRVLGLGFEVEDDGPGILPAERERVFEPFHRLRPRSTGTGLGLNLVRQVIEWHGGHVSILGAPDGGKIVGVEFPAN